MVKECNFKGGKLNCLFFHLIFHSIISADNDLEELCKNAK